MGNPELPLSPREAPTRRLGMSDHSWVHVQIVLNITVFRI